MEEFDIDCIMNSQKVCLQMFSMLHRPLMVRPCMTYTLYLACVENNEVLKLLPMLLDIIYVKKTGKG